MPENPTINELLSTQLDFLRMSLVQQMRIYDVLLVLLGEQDKEAADVLMATHAKFENIGPLPYEELDDGDNS